MAIIPKIAAAADQTQWFDIINYELVKGNAAWRFVLVMLLILVTLVAARIVQFFITRYASKRTLAGTETVATLTLNSLAKPVYVGIFALGFNFCKVFLYFDAEKGINPLILSGWTKVSEVLAAIAGAYALYRLVDVVEYYLNRLVSKTETKLDDMLVPVVRKAMRITIAIVAGLFIAQSVVGREQMTSLILGAGVGGIAIALAAKDTIANFFGSVTIFTDRPFHINERIKIAGHYGTVEEVGFRSTRIRTTQGHLVVIPNNTIANSNIENVSRRPFIRRTSNLTITYDSGCAKTQKALEIIKQVLADTPEVNTDPELVPRVYFSDFNDWSLNIYMSYWVKPADFWLSHEVNERVNLAIMKLFEAENIEFAFPTQTLHVKKDDNG